MNLTTNSNTALNIQDSQENKKDSISQDYKDLNEKCEAVLIKINKRKKNGKESKK